MSKAIVCSALYWKAPLRIMGKSSRTRATLPFHATPEGHREDIRADQRKIFFRAPPASHRMVIWPGDDVGKHKGENLREVFRIPFDDGFRFRSNF